jgi:1-acyl-sn-glycerol-3-phosphate acyltransferase
MILIRSLLLTAWIALSVLVVGILGVPFVLASRLGGAQVMTAWARVAAFGARWICGIKFEVRGLENLPAGPVMIASKHQSMLDTIAPTLFTRLPVYVLKQELLDLPIFGWYCRKAGLIAIDRSGHMSALKAMVAQAKERFEEGRPLIIFPEGTRQVIGAVPDYKPGVAAIYMLLGVPCVPLALNTGTSWPAKGFMRYPGTVVFEFLPMIPPGLKRGPFMELLESQIEGASQALLEEHVVKEALLRKRPRDNSSGDKSSGGDVSYSISSDSNSSSSKASSKSGADTDWGATNNSVGDGGGGGD